MKLMTSEIKQKLPELYSQNNVHNPICSLKYFTPDSSWTFYAVEGSQQENRDWLFFGKVVSPVVPEGELGYFSLSELEKIRGPLGLSIERDLYWTPRPLSECK